MISFMYTGTTAVCRRGGSSGGGGGGGWPPSTPSSWSVCVPTSAVLPTHNLSSLNCPNLFKLSLMTDSRYTGPSLTGNQLQHHTHNCQGKRKPTHGPTHWLGLFLYSPINLSSIRQVGGSSGRCRQTSDRSSSQPLALLICRETKKWNWGSLIRLKL